MSPTTKGMLAEAKRGNELVVTGPHALWLETLETEQIYSEESIQFMADVLRRKFKHDRPGRFSPSAMGECPKRVILGFAGAPQEQPELDSQEMMDHGSWTHLKWQTEGITTGFIPSGQAELWTYNKDLLSGGSMDAKLVDDSLFELKSSGWSIYQRIVNVEGWPKWENLLQVHNYFILSDMDIASVVYENRSSGQFHEFRVTRDIKIEKEVLRRLASYRRYYEDDSYPDMLEMCTQKVGTVYKRCPFRKICPLATSISQFGKVA